MPYDAEKVRTALRHIENAATRMRSAGSRYTTPDFKKHVEAVLWEEYELISDRVTELATMLLKDP